MNELSMIMVLGNLATFNFIFVLFFYFKYKRGITCFRFLLISSLLYALALSTYYFDVKAFNNQNYSVVLTSLTFLFMLGGVTFFTKAYMTLIEVKSFFKTYQVIAFFILAITIKVVFAIDSVTYRTIISNISVLIVIVISLLYSYRSKKDKFLNIVSVEMFIVIGLMLAIYIFDKLSSASSDLESSNNSLKIFIMQIHLMMILMHNAFIILNSSFDHISISNQAKLFEELSNNFKYISEMDELTQIYNRRKMSELINSKIETNRTLNKVFSILVIDIDRFKSVNDTYGHSNGDLVLQETAKFLKENVGDEDYISRWGGDEFLILLSHMNKVQAQVVKDKLQSQNNKIIVDDKHIEISLSIGLCQYQIGMSLEQIFHEADSDLYQDKARLYQ